VLRCVGFRVEHVETAMRAESRHILGQSMFYGMCRLEVARGKLHFMFGCLFP
jgi:hypothetical protein